MPLAVASGNANCISGGRTAWHTCCIRRAFRSRIGRLHSLSVSHCRHRTVMPLAVLVKQSECAFLSLWNSTPISVRIVVKSHCLSRCPQKMLWFFSALLMMSIISGSVK